MKKDRIIRLTARISLISTFLVVLAGSVVRMTGSGMGCPDWPKCFGYYIPPTDVEQVLWKPNSLFKAGRMIVHDNSLWIAKADFESTSSINLNNWDKYTKHDYAIFNAAHTWTEYINRLVGAFTGIPVLITVFLSFFFFRKDVFIPITAMLALFVLGFEAWLGKVVVDGNLIPNQITIHMFGAIVLVALLLILIRLLSENKESDKSLIKNTGFIAGVAFVSLLQILIGTRVREEVDLLAKAGVARTDWIETLSGVFNVHMTFSVAVLVANALLMLKLKNAGFNGVLKLWGSVLGLELIAGLALTYLGFPAWMQPVHLLGAFVLFAIQFSLLIRSIKTPIISIQNSQ